MAGQIKDKYRLKQTGGWKGYKRQMTKLNAGVSKAEPKTLKSSAAVTTMAPNRKATSLKAAATEVVKEKQVEFEEDFISMRNRLRKESTVLYRKQQKELRNIQLQDFIRETRNEQYRLELEDAMER